MEQITKAAEKIGLTDSKEPGANIFWGCSNNLFSFAISSNIVEQMPKPTPSIIIYKVTH
jgi:hypothetical protein